MTNRPPGCSPTLRRFRISVTRLIDTTSKVGPFGGGPAGIRSCASADSTRSAIRNVAIGFGRFITASGPRLREQRPPARAHELVRHAPPFQVERIEQRLPRSHRAKRLEVDIGLEALHTQEPGVDRPRQQREGPFRLSEPDAETCQMEESL